MAKKRIGLIVVPPGAFPSVHEKLTVDYLASHIRQDITFLVPNRRIGSKTPDIEMDGLKWEMKSPKGKKTRIIENNLRYAARQSPNVIFDLRRVDGRIPTRKISQRNRATVQPSEDTQTHHCYYSRAKPH